MKNMWVVFIFVGVFALGYAVLTSNMATAAAPTTTSCKNCHTDLAALLPREHTPVEDNVTSCLACHQSDMPGLEKKNPYLTRIHLAHQPPRGDGDCLTCHSWAIGKSFGLIGAPGSWGAPTQEDMGVLKEIFASWAESEYLDNRHAKASTTCTNCHGTKLPALDATVDNKGCLKCHGPMEELVKKTEPADFKDRNPHLSHLGEIDCTVCHKAHGESKVYCLGCHQKFTMTIPGGEIPKKQ